MSRTTFVISKKNSLLIQAFFFRRSNGPKRLSRIKTISVIEIGVDQKNDESPFESMTARRNSLSAIGPRITPRIIQGVEKPQRFIR